MSEPAARTNQLTEAERVAVGKAARAEVPRSVHATWEPAPDRPSPVDLLEEQAATRVPELVPIRYGRMLVSPFTFYRGAAYLMASDLSRSPRTSLTSQLCGDAHLSNFGVFAAADRRLIFSINDFDETLPGPFEWDVKRLVTSFEVASRDRGFDTKDRRAINETVARSYREAMRDMSRMNILDLWYLRLDVDEITAMLREQLNRTQKKRMEGNLAKARAKDSMRAFNKLVREVDGRPRLVGDPPLIVPVADLVPDAEYEAVQATMEGLLSSYRSTLRSDHRHLLERFRYIDAARKVVGVGSVGTRAWVVLMLGRENGDPLMLQAKEAQASVLEAFLGAAAQDNHGERVVAGQQVMQASSDVMLGWVRSSGFDQATRDFYVRQLWDGKGSAQVDIFEPTEMSTYGKFCGWTLAKAHARSGDAVAMASYLGNGATFDQAIATFAEKYADQNERDYATLKEAVTTGRLTAEAGL
jgi:uncharacterized protein (DUF2252 family)